MASLRSEYDDKNLKKNAFSGRRLRLELDRLDNQRDQLSKQFRQEKDQLRKQLAEGGEILKLKSLEPNEIQPPLSSTDRKKLSPRFARKLSGSPQQLNTTLPPIVTASDTSTLTQSSPHGIDKRRFSLPPMIAMSESRDLERKRTVESLAVPKLLQRRASANNALQNDNENISDRINEFYQKLSKSSEILGAHNDKENEKSN